MAWRELSVVCDAERAAALEATLEAAGALAVSVDDAADGALFEPAPGEHPLWRRCRLSGLFDDVAGADSALALLAAEHGAALASEVEQRDLAERDWLTENQAALPPTRFGDRLWVVPPGTAAPEAGAVCVQMVPGLAFGSGAHESTALCLEWLDGEALEGRDVVDFGCGSGILAIAAARLGAARVYAVDHDPQAITATTANARANGVGGVVLASEAGGLPPGLVVDVIVANILAGTLVELAPRLAALLRPGGRIALAGILGHQGETVRAAYAPWVSALELHARGEWLRVSGTRRSDKAG